MQFVFESVEYHVFSRLRSIEGTLIASWGGEGPVADDSGRQMVYVSFDADSVVHSHVIDQLRYFSNQGYRIVFVSTSPSFSEKSREAIRPFVWKSLHRKNVGYDFASYRLGYEVLKSESADFESLIVMNDSCTGPWFDFSHRLEEMRQDSTAVYGMTKSHEITEYIQSYFFHFGEGLARSGALDRYFDRIRILGSKWAIVRFLEIGGSRWLRNHGVSLKALVDPADPSVREVLERHSITEPTRDPAASEFQAMGLLPFRKRKHGMA